MDASNLHTLTQTLTVWTAEVGMKVLGALALWLIGRRLIHFGVALMTRGLQKQAIDKTLIGFLGSTVSVVLNVVLIVAILGFFGVETTSFAALLAGAGLAIGAAWSGLLANFAAGVFLVILRPFKTGDVISAGGVTGTVEEVGMFVTTVNTADNVRTFVGNNAIFSGNIQNFSANPYRRVDLVAQLNGSVDHQAAIGLLKDRLAKIPNVKTDPAPVVEIQEFTAFGPLLAVRPFCENKDYWQVYFDTNKTIREAFGDAGFPAPEQRVFIRPSA
jgi:small conductance mechanosensitive channel